MLEPAAETLKHVTRTMKDQSERLLARQKRRAAEELRTVGTSVRHAAEELRQGPLEPVGRFVGAFAEGITRASWHLEEQDLQGLLAEAEDIVRRRPEWFLGGMFITGLVLARFAKASASGPASDVTSQPRARRVRPTRAPRKRT